MSPCIICCCSSVSCRNSSGVESTSPLNVPCDVWHQDVSSRSFKSRCAATDRTSCSIISHKFLIELSWLRGQGNTLKSSLCFYKVPHFQTMHSLAGCIIVLKEAIAVREYHWHVPGPQRSWGWWHVLNCGPRECPDSEFPNRTLPSVSWCHHIAG